METNLYKKSDKKNIYSSLILIISLLIVFFITKDMYFENVEKNANLEALNTQSNELQSELQELNKIKADLDKNVKMKKILNQFGWEYREDRVVNNIFPKNINWLTIWGISMDKWNKLPNWLSLANISVNVEAEKIIDLVNYLDYLTSENSDIRFLVKNISVPFGADMNMNQKIQVPINLWMYYFSK
ncbi:MAG: hypothetical protein ACD_4C00337G0004 [uncultured bacterium (gcode 4)]|uniref:Uncharacterized protein n=1 Tax=uncultured bacterium (gcode 4) TaxID=1234023 RepID=K2F5E4_9BACT|nr:MAG: hypothetical protein ACD_4C00337G0004 [uncultured bacterium (gcode 4)]